MTTQTHTCPGKACPRQVVPSEFACPSCWRQLPWTVRRRITQNYRLGNYEAHVQAMSEALALLGGLDDPTEDPYDSVNE